MEALFPMGRCVITAKAADTLHAQDVQASLHRHGRGDWGEVDVDDQKANDVAPAQGLRLFSRYHDRAGTRFYIITEHDRSVTTVVLPEDY